MTPPRDTQQPCPVPACTQVLTVARTHEDGTEARCPCRAERLQIGQRLERLPLSETDRREA